MVTTTKKFQATSNAIKHGYRSGLEEVLAEQLERAGLPVNYETMKVPFKRPEKPSTYTPDFVFCNGKLIIEGKGRFLTEDRQKQKLIKQQHPELDIRFVFSNSRARISKTSNTTYAKWCEDNGFQYADKRIPVEWIEEIRQLEAQQKE